MWPLPRRCRSCPSRIVRESMSRSSRNPKRAFWDWGAKTPLSGLSHVPRDETANGGGAAGRGRAIVARLRAPRRGRDPKVTGHRATGVKDRGAARDPGATREAGDVPRPSRRKDRISARHDQPVLLGTTEPSDRRIVPEMTGTASRRAATVRAVLPAHHERERQG
jgi:hypothetical protein